MDRKIVRLAADGGLSLDGARFPIHMFLICSIAFACGMVVRFSSIAKFLGIPTFLTATMPISARKM
jgi:hypothetical protein